MWQVVYRGIVRDHQDALLPVTLQIAERWGDLTAAARKGAKYSLNVENAAGS